MNGAIHAATTEQGRVGRVDDGVHVEAGDVGLQDLDPARHGSPLGRFGALSLNRLEQRGDPQSADGALGDGAELHAPVLPALAMRVKRRTTLTALDAARDGRAPAPRRRGSARLSRSKASRSASACAAEVSDISTRPRCLR
jgi:hypothetical protein